MNKPPNLLAVYSRDYDVEDPDDKKDALLGYAEVTVREVPMSKMEKLDFAFKVGPFDPVRIEHEVVFVKWEPKA